MNSNPDFDRIAQSWLQDGPTEMPDRSIQAALDEVHTTSQQRFGAARRTFNMNGNALRLAGAAAVALFIIVAGGIYLGNTNRSGGVGGPPAATAAPTATPKPTPTATPAPSVSVVPTLGQASTVPCAPGAADSCGVAGTYRLSGGDGVWPVTVTIDEPAGWFEPELGTGWDALLVDKGRGPSGWGVMFYTVGDVALDPCDSTKGRIPAAQVDTPQKLAAAMSAWPRFTATTPQPITIDGHSGLKFKLTSTAKASCAGTASAGHSASGDTVDVYPMVDSNGAHDPATVEIVDTGNGLLVIRATDFPQTTPFEVDGGRSPDPTFHAGDQADLHAILDSIRLTALPATP